MGMYTKINAIIPIEKDTPRTILNDLQGMFDGDDARVSQEIRDKLKRWWFPNSAGSYYFTGTHNSAIKNNEQKTYACVLHIDTDFKNYDDEINKFMKWISPYVDCSDNTFIGYSLYEEDEIPTLYFYRKGKIQGVEIKFDE